MWTEIKDDGLKNDESILVILFKVKDHVSFGTLIIWDGFVLTEMGV
jgi:hypothetical protein